MSCVAKTAIAGLCLAVWGVAQRPPDADVEAEIARARQKAMEYNRTLPDFVCTETIQRYVESGLRGASWKAADKLTVRLTYFQQREDHKLVLVNGMPTDTPFEKLSGSIGVGEFGGTLTSIFDPQAETAFHWERVRTVQKRKVAVYSYTVSAERSRYEMISGRNGTDTKGMVGLHGLVEFDPDSGEVVHLTYLADHIPRSLNIEYARTEVEYGLADVGGRQYLLPIHSETEMHSPGFSTRNEMDFKEYRKFSSDSVITFGDGK